MKDDNNETGFVQRVTKVLDQADQNLDPNTLRRLREDRNNALQSPIKRPFFLRPLVAFPVMVATAATLLLVVLFRPGDPPSVSFNSGTEDIDIIAAQEEFEFYADLDFYIFVSEVQPRG